MSKDHSHKSAKERATERIKSAKIVTRLINVINGTEEMTLIQFNACRLLLGKTMPDLKAIELEHGGAIQIEAIEHTIVDSQATDS